MLCFFSLCTKNYYRGVPCSKEISVVSSLLNIWCKIICFTAFLLITVVNFLDIIHIYEIWSIKPIRMLNHESQVIYSEPTSNAVDFEMLLQSDSILWPKFMKYC